MEMTGPTEDKGYLSDPEQECQARVQEFEADTEDDIAELAALGKAVAILPEEFVLERTSSCVRLTGDSRDKLDGRSSGRGGGAEDDAEARVPKPTK